MADRSLGRTVWNLILALLNATLILVAVCLFFAWKITQTADAVVANVETRLAEFTPVQERIGGLSEEVRTLRADLAALGGGTGRSDDTVLARIEERVAQVAARLDAVAVEAETLIDAPGDLIDRAIGTAGDEAERVLSGLRNCYLADRRPAS